MSLSYNNNNNTKIYNAHAINMWFMRDK